MLYSTCCIRSHPETLLSSHGSVNVANVIHSLFPGIVNVLNVILSREVITDRFPDESSSHAWEEPDAQSSIYLRSSRLRTGLIFSLS